MHDHPLAFIETLRVRAGRIPLLDGHVARFERARRALGFEAPVPSLAALASSHVETRDAIVRIEVRDGRADSDVRPFVERDPPAVITAATPHTPYPHKTNRRAPFDSAAVEASEAGADDALLLTRDGAVAEGTTWSVFWWEGEILLTPALDLGVLDSVARARILDLVPRAAEGTYRRSALTGRSVFLANAVRGVQAIARLDGALVPLDTRTDALAQAFWPTRA